MPRWASRLMLEITDVRVQRLNGISEEDARAEGIQSFTKDGSLFKYWACDPCDGPLKSEWSSLPYSARDAFASLWNFINGPDAWGQNPWVFAISLKVVTP